MGSGRNNRKGNDQPVIRRPIREISFGIGIPDAGGIVAEVCIPSFDQRVKKSNLTQSGIKVRLQKEANLFIIYIGENAIGQLNETRSAMVAKCISLGVRYAGEIAVKKGNVYARFTRISR